MKKFHKILLVDDDAATNFLAGVVLRDLDITDEIQVADDGAVACELIGQNGCPDIIFLDIRMPRMDGFDFLDKFNTMSVCKNVKIVMLTTSVRAEDKEKALAYKNVVDYIEKPLTEEIVQKIASVFFP